MEVFFAITAPFLDLNLPLPILPLSWASSLLLPLFHPPLPLAQHLSALAAVGLDMHLWNTTGLPTYSPGIKKRFMALFQNPALAQRLQC